MEERLRFVARLLDGDVLRHVLRLLLVQARRIGGNGVGASAAIAVVSEPVITGTRRKYRLI